MRQDDRDGANGRRRALLLVAGLCGLAANADAFAALAAGRRSPPLLAPDALALTAVLAEIVIPATDTPGALAVGAHLTIDHMLRNCATAATRNQFKAGLASLDAAARAQGGRHFRALAPARQRALLRALDAGAAPFTPADRAFFALFKSYTLFAYYTSEAGSTLELAYLPVPGGFTGNFPVRKDTRTWTI
nr:gluconate 2-dehydrogenase subunit 3 family protein [uncultured Duganella sp.]